jgi:hypothetical protein
MSVGVARPRSYPQAHESFSGVDPGRSINGVVVVLVPPYS